ncbi:unnamed protein product [Discosporangium mesarthrocarpum]
MHAFEKTLALVALLVACNGFVVPVPSFSSRGVKAWHSLQRSCSKMSPVVAVGALSMSSSPDAESGGVEVAGVEGAGVEDAAVEGATVDAAVEGAEEGAEEGATVEDAEAAAPVEVAPAAPVVAGPAMPTQEQLNPAPKGKDPEIENLQKKWAGKSLTRGIILQGVVLAFIAFLSVKPQEVSNLSICAPLQKTGCVDFITWLEVVFGGAPVPPGL